MEWSKTIFDGLMGYTVQTGVWRMTVITQCGPRIAFLGKNGDENLLYWDTNGVVRNGWKLMGGHRVWLTRPMADESEDTYLPDNDPCSVRVDGRTITVTAPASPVNRLERGMRISCVEDGRFTVTNFVRNTGELIYSGGVWSPTCIVPDGRELRVPLGQEHVTWDLVRVVIPRIFAGNRTQLEDSQVCFEGNDLVIRPRGRVLKRCVAAPKGLVLMRWPKQNITFAKRMSWRSGGRYQMDGCNIAVFVGQDNRMAELETYGEEQPILPGQSIAHEEAWVVTA